MIKYLISLLVGVRETCLAIFVAGLAYTNLSPDSQHGFIGHVMEVTEQGHIWLAVASFAVFAGSFMFVIFRHRKGIGRILKKLFDEARQIGKR